MLRVLHITDCLDGGVRSVVMSLVTHQVSRGMDVTVIYSRAPHSTSEGPEVEFPNDVRTFELRPETNRLRNFFRILFMRSHALKDADVVHAHSSIAGAALRVRFGFSARANRLLYSPHGYGFLRLDIPRWKRSLYLLIERALGKTLATTHAVSRSELEITRNVVRSQRSFLVENGVKMNSNLTSDTLGTKSVKKRVITVGRICPQKNPKAFRVLARKFHQTAEFSWLGTGPAEDIRALKEDHVTVSGWLPQTQLIEVIRNADIFVLLSLWEGMPIALLEAMSCGVPAIVSDVPGNRDLVIHGVTGYVVKNELEAERALKELLKDEILLRRMSVSTKDESRNYTVEKMCENMDNLYSALNSTRKKPTELQG